MIATTRPRTHPFGVMGVVFGLYTAVQSALILADFYLRERLGPAADHSARALARVGIPESIVMLPLGVACVALAFMLLRQRPHAVRVMRGWAVLCLVAVAARVLALELVTVPTYAGGMTTSMHGILLLRMLGQAAYAVWVLGWLRAT